MKSKHTRRALLRTASIVGILLITLGNRVDASETAIPEGKGWFMSTAEWRLMSFVIATYGKTDWSPVVDELFRNPDDAGNPDVMKIPIALGNALLDRYVVERTTTDYEDAFHYFNWTAENYALWNSHPSSLQLAVDLAVSVNRMRRPCEDGFELPAIESKRIARLWKTVVAIVKVEAGYRLHVAGPSGELARIVPPPRRIGTTLVPFRSDVDMPAKPVTAVSTAEELLEAVSKARSVLEYVMVSRLLRLPAESPCDDVRYSMPDDGETE